MLKLLTIIGARPQIIKAAAISRTIRNSYPDRIQETIVHTGQHYDDNMSEVFFTELDLPEPKFNLGIGSDSHARQTAAMMDKLETVLVSEMPDFVLVYGDTNTALAGAVVAAKIPVPLIHVEGDAVVRDEFVSG